MERPTPARHRAKCKNRFIVCLGMTAIRPGKRVSLAARFVKGSLSYVGRDP
nr:MAG TPA: hypothetical protein [Caudoviricetes sp.]